MNKQTGQDEQDNSYHLFEPHNLMMELTMQDAQEKTTEVLFTEINAEESATVNGGNCGYSGYNYYRPNYYRPSSYNYQPRYYRTVSYGYNYGYPCY